MTESKTTIMDVLRWGYWRVRFAFCGVVCRFVGHDEKCDEVWAGDQRMDMNPWCDRCNVNLD